MTNAIAATCYCGNSVEAGSLYRVAASRKVIGEAFCPKCGFSVSLIEDVPKKKNIQAAKTEISVEVRRRWTWGQRRFAARIASGEVKL